MIKPLNSIAAGLALAAAATTATTTAAVAAPITMAFEASGFENAGIQHPGFAGPVHGSITWEGDPAHLADPIAGLLAIDLEIAGHRYTLGEVGIANQGSTQTAFGALVRGANAVVGDGGYHDFLIVFDRVNPQIQAFAYSIAGLGAAIWWQPAHTSARFVTSNGVPEPASLALAALALAGIGAASMRRRPAVATAA